MHPSPPVTGRVSRRVRPRECGGPKALALWWVWGRSSERTQKIGRVSGLAIGRLRRGAPGGANSFELWLLLDRGSW